MRTLVLWDIDHTLVDIGALSGEIYAAVFFEVTGRQMRQLADMTGRTDRAIVSETLRLHGITPDDEILHVFAETLAVAFAERAEEVRGRGRMLPGARAAQAALADRADVVQSVLTGNMRQIAEGKLDAFGLDNGLDLQVGAYGLDAADRPSLVRLARQRAADRYGEPFDASSTVLVGDTPNDVRAAREGGARVVAVATGASGEETLRAAGAENVLADLGDTDAVVQAVFRVSAV